MTACYNETDPYAAQWLRNLIAAGHIAPGDVDERSIEDVRPEELREYTQCHFFAGIGVWSYALRRAGWRDDEPVWTGSCPCQPFSAAGKRGGNADERHLWPHWFHLIEHGKPRGVPVFGEQVASKDGLAWLDLVHADLEGQGYTVRAADLCAAGVGAPHIRQRLYFVADTSGARTWRDAGAASGEDTRRSVGEGKAERSEGLPDLECCGISGELADADGRDASAEGLQRGGEHGQQQEDGRADRRVADSAHQQQHGRRNAGQRGWSEPTDRSIVGNTDDEGSQGRRVPRAVEERHGAGERAARTPGPVNGFWHPADWLPCIDGKARPVEPGTFPLAHGVAARVGKLRAYGNAIVAPVAEEFIRAYLEQSALEQLL